jgi:hypothetical protein
MRILMAGGELIGLPRIVFEIDAGQSLGKIEKMDGDACLISVHRRDRVI